jgi:hypothetical protein
VRLRWQRLPGVVLMDASYVGTVALQRVDGSLPLDSFRAGRMPAAEGLGQDRTRSFTPCWRSTATGQGGFAG